MALCLALGAACFFPGLATARPDQPAQRIVPGEVLVQFREGTPRERIEEILAELELRMGKPLGSPLLYVLEFPAQRRVREVIRRLKTFPEVRAAEPNYITPLDPPPGRPRPPVRKTPAAPDGTP